FPAVGTFYGLKYYFGPQSYARLVAALGSNVDSLTDAQVSPYADVAFQFDNVQRATQATIQGAGCSSCGGGLGTFTYAYTASTFPDAPNYWRTKNVENLPDGNQNIVYTNFLGQVLLSVYKDTTSGTQWITHHVYDNTYHEIEQDNPSAVASYTEAKNLGVILNTSNALINL